MGIGMVVLLLAVTSLDSASTGYGRNTDGIAAEREARAVLTQIAGDLSSAVWHEDTVLENKGGDRPTDRLGFLMLQPADAQTEGKRIGDLCATVYYIKDIETSGRSMRCLMRGFRNSEATFDALRDHDVPSLFAEEEADEPVSFGVLSFDVSPLRRNANGGWEEWQEDIVEASPRVPEPDAVRIRLVVARRELAAKLVRAEDWTASPRLPAHDRVGESNQVETYEIVQAFAHPS